MIQSAQGMGKVILFGEHAVVYGVPALAVALDRGATATLQEGPPEVSLPGLGLRFSLERGEPASRGLDQALLAILGERPLPKTLSIELTIPPSRGLGSSAAICVAVARLFSQDDASVIQAASAGERVFHGTPSGIDIAASVSGSGILFTKQDPPLIEPIHAKTRFTLLIADSGQRGVTKEIVAQIRAQREADPQRVKAIFLGISQIVTEATKALQAGEVARLGALFSENQRRLQELGLSTPKLDAGISAAIEAGAYGAKLTGAGAGGCLIALAKEGYEERIREALSSVGFSLVDAQLAPGFFL